METICVFLGSSVGKRKIYSETTKDLATSIIDHGYKIVFGGGNVGLMGILADAALAANGHVTGIITEQLNGVEVGHKGLSELVIVQSMHERKKKWRNDPMRLFVCLEESGLGKNFLNH